MYKILVNIKAVLKIPSEPAVGKNGLRENGFCLLRKRYVSVSAGRRLLGQVCGCHVSVLAFIINDGPLGVVSPCNGYFLPGS